MCSINAVDPQASLQPPTTCSDTRSYFHSNFFLLSSKYTQIQMMLKLLQILANYNDIIEYYDIHPEFCIANHTSPSPTTLPTTNTITITVKTNLQKISQIYVQNKHWLSSKFIWCGAPDQKLHNQPINLLYYVHVICSNICYPKC